MDTHAQTRQVVVRCAIERCLCRTFLSCSAQLSVVCNVCIPISTHSSLYIHTMSSSQKNEVLLSHTIFLMGALGSSIAEFSAAVFLANIHTMTLPFAVGILGVCGSITLLASHCMQSTDSVAAIVLGFLLTELFLSSAIYASLVVDGKTSLEVAFVAFNWCAFICMTLGMLGAIVRISKRWITAAGGDGTQKGPCVRKAPPPKLVVIHTSTVV